MRDNPSDPAVFLTPPRGGTSHGGASDLGLYGAAPAAFVAWVEPPDDARAAFSLAPPALSVPAASEPAHPIAIAHPVEFPSTFHAFGAPAHSPLPMLASAPQTIMPVASSDAGYSTFTANAIAAPPLVSPELMALQQHSEVLKQAIVDLGVTAAAAETPHNEIQPILAVQQQAAEMIGSMNRLLEGKLSATAAHDGAWPLVPSDLASALTELMRPLDLSTRALLDDAGTTLAGLDTHVKATLAGLHDLGQATLAELSTRTEDAITASFHALGEPLQDIATSLTGPSQSIVAALGESVGTAAGLTENVSGGLVNLVERLPDAVADGAGVLPNDQASPFAATAGGIEASLAELKGADPLGGIQTLTGLVSAADVFALHDEVSTGLDMPDALGALGMLDVLAPGDETDGLLGLTHTLHHDLGGLHDFDLGHG